MKTMMKVKNITKDYGHQRGVFDLSFNVEAGEVMGFLGPNGAGKTTTIRTLMGFIQPCLLYTSNLVVEFEALADRITGRRMCKNCGAIYHVRNHPSQVDGICDVCGSPLIQRADDTEEMCIRDRSSVLPPSSL